MKSKQQDPSRVEPLRVLIYADSSILWHSSASQYSHLLGVNRTEVRPDYQRIKSKAQHESLKALVRMGLSPSIEQAKGSTEFDLHLCISSSRSASTGSGRGFLDRMEEIGWQTHVVHRGKGSQRFDWAPSICCMVAEEVIKAPPSFVTVCSGAGTLLPLEALCQRQGVPFMMMGYLDSLCAQYTYTAHFDERTLMTLNGKGWGAV